MSDLTPGERDYRLTVDVLGSTFYGTLTRASEPDRVRTIKGRIMWASNTSKETNFVVLSGAISNNDKLPNIFEGTLETPSTFVEGKPPDTLEDVLEEYVPEEACCYRVHVNAFSRASLDEQLEKIGYVRKSEE